MINNILLERDLYHFYKTYLEDNPDKVDFYISFQNMFPNYEDFRIIFNNFNYILDDYILDFSFLDDDDKINYKKITKEFVLIYEETLRKLYAKIKFKL